VSGSVASGAAPTGTVSFYVSSPNAGLLGTVTVGTVGAGIAKGVFQTSNLPSGALTVYAVYNGDTNFSSAISNSITIGISDYALSFVPTTLALNQGQTGTAVGTVSVIANFSGTIILGCSPAPATFIACSFSPASLSGAGTTTLTVTTTAPKTAAVRGGSLKLAGEASLAALLCCFLPIGRRRRVPAMLLVLLALGLTMNLGCNANTLVSPIEQSAAGTPLGTTLLTIDTVGTNGTTTVNHDYTYQVTVQ
jgi:hypothetical protein